MPIIYFNFHSSPNVYFILILFQGFKKNIIFFVKQYIIQSYSPKKMENKKTRSKSYYQANKEKLQKVSCEYYRNLFQDKKFRK